MQEISVGQRWISAAELQLGIGQVVEVEHRTVSIIFPATNETRTYARQDAPLSRVRFNPGDWVQNQQGEDLQVVELNESAGLINYHCEDKAGRVVRLAEAELSHYLQLNRPAERLLSGQIDRNKWFNLRCYTREIANSLSQSPVYGLAGCRTSLLAHQIYIAYEVSRRYAPRVLLADEVGLGKTIEAGLIMHQQLLAERVKRVLIVVPESLVFQWLVEMLRRFNLMFSVFDEERCDAMHDADDEDSAEIGNPFHSEQLIICSLQFLVENQSRAEQAVAGEWDLLIVDEAHHLAWSENSVSPEYQTIESLAMQTPGILLLTATPEQLGKESHFARLRLLDPNRFSDLASFLREETNYAPLADVVDVLQQDSSLNDDHLRVLQQTLDEGDNRQWLGQLDSEDAVIRAQAQQALIEHLLDRHGTGRVLFRNTRHVIKGFPQRELHAYPLSAPDRWPGQNIKADRETVDPDDLVAQKLILGDTGKPASNSLDPRVNWLGAFLRDNKKNKVLVIAALAETAVGLADQVKALSGIRAAVFHEGLTLVERDRAAAWFADHDAGAQVLICSEIGSEGRNFQFAHHLVLFDLPMNPDLLEQRIGRLDRIGQNAVINIHVPYFENSAQETLFRWYHEGLNAFNQTCPAGHQVFVQMHKELMAHLKDPTLNVESLIKRTHQLYLQLNQALQQGRDRLLEYNSCRPLIAEDLTDQALNRDTNYDIFQFMERIYDCYGIDSEIRGQDCWVITPSDNMLAKMPGLPEDGMTVTYDRTIALSNEDVRFLSWEHPFVRNAMDMVLTSEFGNTALIAIKYSGAKPGTLLLECHFLMEFADDRKFENQRYFPNSSVSVLVDENKREHSRLLDAESIQQIVQPVDSDTSLKIVKAKQSEISTLLELAAQIADRQVSELVEAAKQRGDAVLGRELDRLNALQQINANVRDDEIEFFRNQLNHFEAALGNAKLRLDAVRVMIAV
ncbi:MAG: RNA polymerase-associated protein RapA [Proteobacteria bacterium]|nr:RNA polymerase-associated protein RapA [Pseudomonadota bacterium]